MNGSNQQNWSVYLYAVDLWRGKHWLAEFLVHYFIQNFTFTSVFILLEGKNAKEINCSLHFYYICMHII